MRRNEGQATKTNFQARCFIVQINDKINLISFFFRWLFLLLFCFRSC